MTYKTLMVRLDPASSNAEVLRVAGELAARFDARIVGIAACQPMQWAYGDGFNSGPVLADCQDELVAELRRAETEFRDALKGGKARLEWRSSFTSEALPYYMACEARCADLILSGAPSAGAQDPARHTGLGDLVIRAGKPVLVVPESGISLPFKRATIAWKDTREARRAVVDCLPLLALVTHVSVLEITDESDVAAAQGRVQDVADWLATHGISATARALPSRSDHAADIDALMDEQNVDLVVAGAYGHSRVREWAFGGVTRTLLKGTRSTLLSH